MKRYFTFFFLIVLQLSLYSQKHDYIWTFGYDSNDDDRCFGGSDISFTKSPPDTIYKFRKPHLTSNSACIADTLGHLEFYTNGCEVFGKSDTTIENGKGLNPGRIADSQCDFGLAGTQNSLILPHPNNHRVYYLFHKTPVITDDADAVLIPFYYTKVDMNENGGEGKVIEKNIPVVNDTLAAGGLTAVKHADGKSWWIINQKYPTNEYYMVRFSETGIDTIFTQAIGFPAQRKRSPSTNSVFSPDGKKYAHFNRNKHLMLMDFDRATGMLSNYRSFNPVGDTINTSGLAFSPDSRFIYMTYAEYVFQYDTDADDIEASKVLVAEYDGFIDRGETYFGNPALAPDCKIYIYSTGRVSKYFHVIEHPNEKGVGCFVNQHSFQLPTYNAFSMHYPPNFRLGLPGDEGYPCDSTLAVSTNINLVKAKREISIFPNPATQEFQIKTFGFEGFFDIEIFSLTGKRVLQKEKITSGSRIKIQKVPPGIYFCKIRGEGVDFEVKKLIIGK